MSFLRILLAVLALALLGAAVGVMLFLWTTRPSGGPGEPIAVLIGQATFRIPPEYVRAGALPRAGSQERVDLALVYPDFSAPRHGGAEPKLFLALLREDGVIDPAERVDQIYGRFLEPDIWSNPGGLLLRRFAADSPYADEELFLSPPDGKAFTARCRRVGPTVQPQPRGADIGEACLWRFRIDGADGVLRFPPELLPQWEELIAGTSRKIVAWRSR